MNIIRRELRLGLKPFVFWIVGIFVLVVAGLIKFTGVSQGGNSMAMITDQIPRVVQALIGIVGINITTIGGYYSVLFYFVSLCASIYGITLASNAVNREAIDKTYEFIFTKPRSRSYILTMKLLAGIIYLTLFILFNILFSIIGIQMLNLGVSMLKEILMFSSTTYLVSILFFSVTALVSTLVKRPDKGAYYANIFFLVTFVIGIVVDMLDNPGVLRVFAPLKYFLPTDILNGEVQFVYVIISVIVIVLTLIGTYKFFNKKDMNAVN